ncbi:hypothetical protein V6Z11_D09G061300 [Gossypium hirsutum]
MTKMLQHDNGRPTASPPVDCRPLSPLSFFFLFYGFLPSSGQIKSPLRRWRSESSSAVLVVGAERRSWAVNAQYLSRCAKLIVIKCFMGRLKPCDSPLSQNYIEIFYTQRIYLLLI